MALDQGHAVEVRAQVLPVFDGDARRLVEADRAGRTPRYLALDAPSSAVAPSIPVTDGTARLPRHPIAVEARVGAPS